MKSARILSLVLSLCVVSAGTILATSTANATTLKSSTTSIITPQIAGIVTVTSTSGANIRSGPGTNYSKIGAANYGAELTYANVSQKDSYGTTWYKIAWGSGYGWISSQVSRLG